MTHKEHMERRKVGCWKYPGRVSKSDRYRFRAGEWYDKHSTDIEAEAQEYLRIFCKFTDREREIFGYDKYEQAMYILDRS